MMSNSTEALVIEIKGAFGDVPYPGDEVNKIGDPLEIDAFAGKRWEDVTLSDIHSNQKLYFFSDVGLRYYLPAYLLAILEHPEDVSYDIRFNLIRDLAEIEAIIRRDQHSKICEGFTPEQRAAIVHFLEDYESFFPFSTTGLSKVEEELLDERKLRTRHLLQTGIDYWKNCSA